LRKRKPCPGPAAFIAPGDGNRHDIGVKKADGRSYSQTTYVRLLVNRASADNKTMRGGGECGIN